MRSERGQDNEVRSERGSVDEVRKTEKRINDEMNDRCGVSEERCRAKLRG